ncbi:MAG: hypothetical protein ACOCUT_00590 [bacterium]
MKKQEVVFDSSNRQRYNVPSRTLLYRLFPINELTRKQKGEMWSRSGETYDSLNDYKKEHVNWLQSRISKHYLQHANIRYIIEQIVSDVEKKRYSADDLKSFINANDQTKEAGLVTSVLYSLKENELNSNTISRSELSEQDIAKLKEEAKGKPSLYREFSDISKIAEKQKFGFLGAQLDIMDGFSKHQGAFATTNEATNNKENAGYRATIQSSNNSKKCTVKNNSQKSLLEALVLGGDIYSNKDGAMNYALLSKSNIHHNIGYSLFGSLINEGNISYNEEESLHGTYIGMGSRLNNNMGFSLRLANVFGADAIINNGVNSLEEAKISKSIIRGNYGNSLRNAKILESYEISRNTDNSLQFAIIENTEKNRIRDNGLSTLKYASINGRILPKFMKRMQGYISKTTGHAV